MGPRDPDLITQRDFGLRPVRTIWRGESGAEQSDLSLSKALAGTGVTSNGIMPGLIYTPLVDPWFKRLANQLGQRRSTGRPGLRAEERPPANGCAARGAERHRRRGLLYRQSAERLYDRHNFPNRRRRHTDGLIPEEESHS